MLIATARWLVLLVVVVLCGAAVDPDVEWLQALYRSTSGDRWQNGCGVGWNVTSADAVACNRSAAASQWATPSGTMMAFLCGAPLNCSGGYYSTWYGVYCTSDDRVQAVQLASCGLAGTLPVGGVGATLASLQGLRLGDNPQLQGPLPASYFAPQLGVLRWLLLGLCGLNGTISIPTPHVVSLEQLVLEGNGLDGAIPDALGSMSRLSVLSLGSNALSGTLPGSFALLSSLTVLDVSSNRLRGTLPGHIASLQRLTDLKVGANRFSGTLPEGWAPSLSSLALLNASYNMLTGSLPAAYAKLTSLQHVVLDGNRLSGTLPLEWTAMPSSSLNPSPGACSFPGIVVPISLRDNCLETVVGNGSSLSPSISPWWLQRTCSGALLVPQRGGELCSMASHTASSSSSSVSVTAAWTVSLGASSSSNTNSERSPSATVTSKSTHVLSEMLAAGTFSSTSVAMSQSQQQPPPAEPPKSQRAQSPTTIASTALAVNGAVMGIGMLLRGVVATSPFGCLPLFQQRTMFVSQRGGSPSGACSDASLGMTDSPSQYVMGPSSNGGSHRGAVVGNVALCAVMVVAATFGGLVASKSISLKRAVRLARLPGWWLSIVVITLLPPTMLSSMVLLVDCRSGDSGSSGWSAANVSIGLAGVGWCVAVAGYVAAVCDPRAAAFKAKFRLKAAGDIAVRDSIKQVVPVWVIRVLGAEGSRWGRVAGSWEDAAAAHAGFVRCHGALFDGAVTGKQWWLTGEVAVSLSQTVVMGTAQLWPTTVSPAAPDGLVAALLIGWCVAHVRCAPFRLRCDGVVASLLAALTAIAALIHAVNGVVVDDNDSSSSKNSVDIAVDVISLVTAVLSFLAAVVPMVAEIRFSSALLDVTGKRWSPHSTTLLLSLFACCCVGTSSTANGHYDRRRRRLRRAARAEWVEVVVENSLEDNKSNSNSSSKNSIPTTFRPVAKERDRRLHQLVIFACMGKKKTT